MLLMATLSKDRTSPIQALYGAVGDLVNTRVDADTGYAVSCLIAQLEEAAEPSGGTGSGVANVYKSPAALEVLALLAEIDRVTTSGLRASGYRARLPALRTDRLHLWQGYAGTWRTLDRDYLAYAIRCAVRWREQAQAILMPDPQVIETRAQPCPSCGKRTAMVWHPDLGERVQRPSLYLDKATLTVYCRCCDAQWGTALWGILRAVLDAS
jgi:hypothetical protein